MKKFLTTIIFLCVNNVFAQDTASMGCFGIHNDMVFMVVEEMSLFSSKSWKKSNELLEKFITDNLKYPSADKSADTLQGDYRVYVTFVVAKDGSICEPKIIRGARKDLDDEALRVVKLMPKWIPGKQNGEPTNVQYNLPIRFAFR